MKPSLHAPLLLASAWISLSPSLHAQGVNLPLSGKDWLVEPSSFKASIETQADGKEISLNNGLVRRTLRLQNHSAATVALDNLMTGESMLRSIKPEAKISLDGKNYPVGGFTGLASKNYFTHAELDALTALPGSFQFSGWEEQPVQPRFEWKKRPDWISRDMPWPPEGKHVVLKFTPPATMTGAATGALLFEDPLTDTPAEGWKIQASKAHPRSSFTNEGKAGELFALADTAVFAERAWPKDARTLEVSLDCGDDTRSNSWGPGFAVVAGDQTISLVARPNSMSFEASGPGFGEKVVGKFDRSKPVTLRARLDGKTIQLEAAQEGAPFQTIASATLSTSPTSFRVGKVGKQGKGQDNPNASGEPVRSHILHVAVRGEADAKAFTPVQGLPHVEVHYEIYDGIPAMSKWLRIINNSNKKVRLDSFSSELLALVETAPKIEAGWTREKVALGVADTETKLLEKNQYTKEAPDAPRDYLDRYMDLFVVTDYAMGGEMEAMKDNPAVHWKHDPEYEKTGIRYYGQYQPALLECAPPLGPQLDIEAGATWESFRTFQLVRDSTDFQRRGLAECQFWRMLAPWTQESPVYMHVTFGDPEKLRAAIDQCHAVGFEMLIMSFGSGYRPDSTDPAYIAKMKELVEYGRQHGVVIGGYSLLASRGGKPDVVTIAKSTGKPSTKRYEGSHFGSTPCLASDWGAEYFKNMRNFHTTTGASVFENDGSYPGDTCASTTHSGHHGFEDSQWKQWEQIRDFYRWCKSQQVFLNIPDWHFLNGANKEPMGYVETNWSLPREQQQIITRQNIHDGTFRKSPTMGFMFVPLTQYHGGGAAATIEPLNEHLDHYETQLASLFGAGVQACYRGSRIYDTEETKAVVQKWVNFYKKHRRILDSDLVHLRRADGRDWDGWLHVDPTGEEKGLAFFYNPLPIEIEREIRLPLYYTGLKGNARIAIEGRNPTALPLNAVGQTRVKVKIPAKGRTWLLVTDA